MIDHQTIMNTIEQGRFEDLQQIGFAVLRKVGTLEPDQRDRFVQELKGNPETAWLAEKDFAGGANVKDDQKVDA
jgi:hypothetical protein